VVPDQKLIQDAWAALLRGDTNEHNRLCDLLLHRIKMRTRVLEGGPMLPGDPIVLKDENLD